MRRLRIEDRPQVASILMAAGNFQAGEAAVALELFDLGVPVGDGLPLDPDYRWLGAEIGAELVGISCYGPTPATEGTFDLYWLAVSELRQGLGVGTALLRSVEQQVAESGGRLLVVETSTGTSYERPRAFYEAKGYDVLAKVRDYYAPGDARLILGRRPR